MFEHINILTLRARFVAKEEGRLPPYLGSTLRGILGHCIRDFVCSAQDVPCHLCDQKGHCAYARCFCSPGNDAGAVNPFILHSLVRDKTEWKIGDICTFDLTLIGKITDRASLFLDALQAMGEYGWGVGRMRFSLEQVIDPVSNTLIFSGGKTWMRNIRPYPLNGSGKTANAVLVCFDAPVRILVRRKLCRTLPFSTFIQALGRRISLLSLVYTGQAMEWDEEKMVKEAESVNTRQENWRMVNFERYSMNHENNKLYLPAIEGWVLYEGNLTPFIPLLEAGSRLHVGKNSTIGFGHYFLAYDR